MYATADAMEALADTLTPDRIDESLKKAPLRLRLLVGAGLAFARTGLKSEPDKVQELSEEGESLVLEMLRHPSTEQAFIVLSTRPKLLKFLTMYSFLRLGIPYVEKKINVVDSNEIVGDNLSKSQSPSIHEPSASGKTISVGQ